MTTSMTPAAQLVRKKKVYSICFSTNFLLLIVLSIQTTT